MNKHIRKFTLEIACIIEIALIVIHLAFAIAASAIDMTLRMIMITPLILVGDGKDSANNFLSFCFDTTKEFASARCNEILREL